MARRVFFSFDYDRDIWRIGQVRNAWVTKPDRETAGYVDAASWESVKKDGKEAILRWIDKQLENTSVTVVLIGYQTSQSEYVDYEIKQSYKRSNGMLGIYINKLKNQDQDIDYQGKNPFENLYIEKDGRKIYLSEIYSTYDWLDNDGYNNLGNWVEDAAKQAGR